MTIHAPNPLNTSASTLSKLFTFYGPAISFVSLYLYLPQYEDAEEVVLWMNTVGPYHNRQETYSYFSLPFCAGPKESIGHYHETLGEALQGTELEFSGLDIDFKSKFTVQ